VKFGLQFHHHVFVGDEPEASFDELDSGEEDLPLVQEETPPASPKGKGSKAAGNVVSLDKFRNKKK
jgi:hypothetical protein